MKSVIAGMSIMFLLAGAFLAQSARTLPAPVKPAPVKPAVPVGQAVEKGAKWLASVQGADGGWGQDGGETSYIRNNERVESNGNDVANTAVAALALLRAGKQYQPNVDRALDF